MGVRAAVTFFVLFLAGAVLVLLLRSCGGGEDEAPPADDGRTGATLAEFNEALARHAANLDATFLIPCSPQLRAVLEQPSSALPGIDLFGELRSMNGICGRFGLTWHDEAVELSDVSYYAGWRILNAVRNGRLDMLDARERETLRAAEALVAGTSGLPVERERRIHDALCERIEYFTDDGPHGDKDCAIGALLNGWADCDGYSDAMVLCCGLAGIPCRYMHGNARETKGFAASRVSKESGHMWNLAKIAGRWVSVDATWDDQDGYISHLSYNLGTKDAALTYRWDPRILFADWAEETNQETQLPPDLRRTVVSSLEDVYFAARQAAVRKVRQFAFVCPGAPLWETAEEEFCRMLSRGGWKHYHYSTMGRLMEARDIQIEENLRFCDTEEACLDAIRDFADAGTGSFSLYFRPGLADALLADDCNGLKRLLARSVLENPGTFSYSPEGGSVTLEDASFAAAPTPCASERELMLLLRSELANRPEALSVLLPSGFDFPVVEDRVFDCVRSMGVATFSWSLVGNRLRLVDLAYHAEFRIVNTRTDVEAYLRSAHNRGKNAPRIFCPPDLYAALEADGARAFRKMLEEAGYVNCRVYVNERLGMLGAER